MRHALFDETAGTFARGIDSRIRQNCYRRGKVFEEAAKASVSPGGVILDYGCGAGRLATVIAQQGFRVRAVDPSPGMISEALRLDTRGLDIEFVVAAEIMTELRPVAYDCIICSSVIEYVDCPEVLLGAFYTSLRKRGSLLLSFANADSLWRRYAKLRFGRTARHFAIQKQVWTWATAKSLLREAGFTDFKGPKYFDGPADSHESSLWLCSSRWVGTLGLVVAKK